MTIGAYLTPALCILVAASFVVGLPYAMARPEQSPREHLLETLNKSGQKHLVFVRYDPIRIAAGEEWIYNDADLPASRVIWARDLGEEKNRRLAHEYPGRLIWLVEPDREAMKRLEYTF